MPSDDGRFLLNMNKNCKIDFSCLTFTVSMPTLPSTCQQLEHSAARDRISVKNKRRQPLKQKVNKFT